MVVARVEVPAIRRTYTLDMGKVEYPLPSTTEVDPSPTAGASVPDTPLGFRCTDQFTRPSISCRVHPTISPVSLQNRPKSPSCKDSGTLDATTLIRLR